MINEELEEIQNGYSWIKVNQFNEESYDDCKDAYDDLQVHHKQETEFLINKCRELAKVIQDYRKWNDD